MSQTGKIALLTGATSGFGQVIAAHLVSKGYEIVVFGRSESKLQDLSDLIRKRFPAAKIDSVECELASIESILKACKHVKQNYQKIDLLVLNAGLWNFQFKETRDQIEETLQVNLLAPMLIYRSLQDIIPRDHSAKVIFTSSGLHQGDIDFSNLEFREKFSGFKAYRQSKLGIILMTRWLASRKENEGISFYAVHPGMVNTNLGRNAGWFSRSVFKLMGKSKEQGAKTHIYLIDHAVDKLGSGEYYANSKAVKTTQASYNMNTAERLYSEILRLIKASEPSHD